MAKTPVFYRLRLTGETTALARSLHPDIKKKIRAGLDAICCNPELGKPLKQQLEGLRSFRIGRFRIIYRTAAKGVLDIVTIGPRRTVYLETYRLLAREPK